MDCREFHYHYHLVMVIVGTLAGEIGSRWLKAFLLMASIFFSEMEEMKGFSE